MDNTIYLNVEQSAAIDRKKAYIKDVAEVFCQDKKIKSHIENIVFMEFHSEKADKKVYSTCYLIEQILLRHSDCQVENLGEAEFIVYYQPKDSNAKLKDTIKIILVSILAFFGAAFSIMTFNTDVTTPELFDDIYEMFTGVEPDGPGILQAAYSIGLFLGVILFFNHGGRYKLTNDPTPLQVQMRQYEQSVNETFITDADRNEDSTTE